MRRLIAIILTLFLLNPSYGIASTQFSADGVQLIRVALIREKDNLKQFKISIRGEYYIFNAKSQKAIIKSKSLRKAVVRVNEGKIEVDGKLYQQKHLRFVSRKFISLFLNNKHLKFRGYVDVLIKKNRLVILNVLPIEEYVKGILYHELPAKPPASLETMKVQAVASRTYAIYQIQSNKDKDYDVTNNIYSQVYGGKRAERFRSNIAVNRTKGEILTYEGKVLPTYFHSTCSGHTEDVRQLWNHDLPPLYGIKCEYCRPAPLYKWKKNFRSSEIQEKLNKNGYNIDLIKNIRILGRNKSGRIKNLEIETRGGRKVIIPGKKFRLIVGPNDIKSNQYEIEMEGYFFNVYGKGWGHGVGMCQWGAYHMGKKKFKYDEILSFYYPGSALTNWQDVKQDLIEGNK